jgi:hypothetical protein
MYRSGLLVEATVALMLNQGTIRKKGCNPRLNDLVGQVFPGAFFLDKQKK